MLEMIPLGIGAGFITAKKIAGKKAGERGKLPSLRFGVKGYNFHVHHWFWCLAMIIALIFLIDVKINKMTLFIIGGLGGSVLQGILCYEDWHHVVKKKAA